MICVKFREVKMISIVSCTIDLNIRGYFSIYFFAKERRDCSITQNKCSFLIRHEIDGLTIFYLSVFSNLHPNLKNPDLKVMIIHLLKHMCLSICI
jgi:hypothetical protein